MTTPGEVGADGRLLMRAAVYDRNGPPGVLRVVERARPEPGLGEVLVRIVASGLNPTDVKGRARRPVIGEMTPHHDGAGVVEATGRGATRFAPGDRVWIHSAAAGRTGGTAAEFVAIDERRVASLPAHADFALGATLGVPAMTAHRALTVHEGAPDVLTPGALDGHVVLVQGGAGAVGHAAIELARWAGATVLVTVSSTTKGRLAVAAGAHVVIDRSSEPVAERVWEHAPNGVGTIVEVAAGRHARLDGDLLAPGGTVVIYANAGNEPITLDLVPYLSRNARAQFVSVFVMPEAAIAAAHTGVSLALVDGALRAGESAGLPLHRFPLDSVAAAHEAIERGAVGKVILDIGSRNLHDTQSL